MVTPRGLVMVIISIALTFVIVERLFGGMIYERLTSRRKYTSAN
jgi:flagellar motor switch protein FliM